MNDAIDFRDVRILNSPDVSTWPITSEITRLGLFPSALHLEHTKQGHWPPVKFQDADQEATLWIILRIGGQWYASGVERIRPGQIDKPEGLPSQVRENWYYDVSRWGIMAAHQPTPGELVGFMVTAGDARGFGEVRVMERSAIVLVHFPADGGGFYLPFETLDDPPPPPPPPNGPPPPPPPSDADKLAAAIDRFLGGVEMMTRAMAALTSRVDTLQQQGLKVHL